MKKAATILLLILLVFNWIGYRLLTGIIEQRSAIALDFLMDHSEYDESSLIEIRVPLNAPYLSGNSTDFERYYGEVEIDGFHYKYLKRKVLNNELVLLCLPDESKNRIQNSRVEFFKLVNDLDNTSSTGKEKNSSASSKNFTAFFTQENNLYTLDPVSVLVSSHAARNNSFPEPSFLSISKPPPKI